MLICSVRLLGRKNQRQTPKTLVNSLRLIVTQAASIRPSHICYTSRFGVTRVVVLLLLLFSTCFVCLAHGWHVDRTPDEAYALF